MGMIQSHRLKPIHKQHQPVTISEEDISDIQAQLQLINQQEHILRSLHLSLATFVQQRYGIDMEDQWTLDLDQGVFIPGDTDADANEPA
jgi:hypothetical protein